MSHEQAAGQSARERAEEDRQTGRAHITEDLAAASPTPAAQSAAPNLIKPAAPHPPAPIITGLPIATEFAPTTSSAATRSAVVNPPSLPAGAPTSGTPAEPSNVQKAAQIRLRPVLNSVQLAMKAAGLHYAGPLGAPVDARLACEHNQLTKRLQVMTRTPRCMWAIPSMKAFWCGYQ